MKRLLLIVPLALLFAGCGSGPIEGTVTAKLYPAGTQEECSISNPVVMVEECRTTSDDAYKIVIENKDHSSAMWHDWTQEYAYVCVSPSRWRATAIGSHFVVHWRTDDYNCDG